jgi:hypothetical protein
MAALLPFELTTQVNRRLLSSSNWAKPTVDTANKLADWEAMPQEQSAVAAIEQRVGAATTLDTGARKLLSFFGRHNTRLGHTNFLAGRFRQTGQVNTMPDVTTDAISQSQADVEDQEASQERDAESDVARKLLSTFAPVKPTMAFGKALDRVVGDITNQESDTADAIRAAELAAARSYRP